MIDFSLISCMECHSGSLFTSMYTVIKNDIGKCHSYICFYIVDIVDGASISNTLSTGGLLVHLVS